jgi:hypothetical protein
MVFVAIAVPLILVAIGLSVYFKRGSDQQYLENFTQAVTAAQLTEDQTDPEILRSAWGLTLFWLDKAETNQVTSESIALRQQAQLGLDMLDSIFRLDFQPVLASELPVGTTITQIVPFSNDLYLLNSTQGNVLRTFLTGRGYELDASFQCGPGPSGSYIIGEVVDIVPMPKGNEFGATILAIDKTGNVLFCGPGTASTSIPLEPPDINWGKITAIAYQSEMLYVLDPANNAVWVYAGTSAYREKPYLFFGKNIPPTEDVIDIAINADDMYLLHSDGHLTLCTAIFGAEYGTRCTDPAEYNDSRPGHPGNAAILPYAVFNQIQYTQPPDPSIYFLDPSGGAIYHFSLRLNLQRVLRSFPAPNSPFPNRSATGFAVGSNRMVYMAFGNKLYYAFIQ